MRRATPYSYDNVGNITNRNNNGFNTNDDVSRNSEQSYEYDEMDRLTGSSGKFDYETWNPFWDKRVNTYTSEYNYSTTGKILQKTQENKGLLQETNETVTIAETTYDWSYEYTGSHPNAVTKAGPRTYSYDLNGNMTQMTVSPDSPLTPGGGTVRTFVWDDENRLLKTTDKSGTNENITSYCYDAAGMRALKKGKYGTVQYVSDNYTVRNKDLISKHVFAGNTRLVSKTVMQEEKSGKMTATEQGAYYYHADHLGSSSVVTDKAGKFYEQIEYFPYGETWINNKANNEQSSSPYKFTAKEYDEETGLYYYGARYYDAKLSRWCSADPPLARGDYLPVPPVNDKAKERNSNLPGMGGVFNSINLDAYHYAGDNPVKFVDPDGNADILILKDKDKKGILDSQALLFKNGTFEGVKFIAFQIWACIKEVFGGTVGKGDAEFFLGKADKTFNKFKTISDDTSKYGVVAAGNVYNYRKSGWRPKGGQSAYLLSDPDLGDGKVPQDQEFGNPIGKNPSYPDRDPSYLLGAHLHRSYPGGTGSKGCIIQEGFDKPGGLGHYLDGNPEEQTGRVLIFR